MSPMPPRFEDQEVWRCARSLAREVYAVTESGGFGRDWALCEAARREVLRATAIIAELVVPGPVGARADRVLAARAALAALTSHLYVALDQGHLGSDELFRLRAAADEVRSLLPGPARSREAA